MTANQIANALLVPPGICYLLFAITFIGSLLGIRAMIKIDTYFLNLSNKSSKYLYRVVITTVGILSLLMVISFGISVSMIFASLLNRGKIFSLIMTMPLFGICVYVVTLYMSRSKNIDRKG